MPVEVTDNSESRCPVRRSGRQPKRTDKLEEFLLTTKRATRRSAPAGLESGDPPSQTPTDAETASEASFDGDAAVLDDKVDYPERRTRSSTRSQTQMKTRGGRQTRGRSRAAAKDDGSSENEDDSINVVKKEISKEDQDGEVDPSSKEGNNVSQTQLEKDSDNKEAAEERSQPGSNNEKDETYINKKRAVRNATSAAASPAVLETKLRANQSAVKTRKPQAQDEEDDEDDDDDSSTSSSSSSTESEDGGYDPNALYCICRQKHNKRFMICCDRCEEWFHGDCVGITEARGRLMERNGEDYICPNCTAKKNQAGKAKPDAASPVGAAAIASSAVTPTNTNASGAVSGLSAAQVVAAATPLASAGPEERGSEDMGIKGRIEKATNPTGKKKIKIFQPVATEEESSLPKCIGPGCDNNAQPDSVYCGNDCILRHAAAAMKSITDVKEPQQKTNTQKNKSTPQKTARDESDSEDDVSPDPDEDDEDKHAVEHPPPPATASWSSDHNYIAVTPEKTAPISSTVLNKKCMYLFEGCVFNCPSFCGCQAVFSKVFASY
uniref:PHD-type domain-containing protein n=1 Tax=Salarias fasciatus TaxID=181472 RepID=A0A672IUR9_SALFA